MGDWFSRLLGKVAGAIVILAVLAWLMRVIYDFLAPAIPFLVGFAVLMLVVAIIIRRRQGW
jgi:UDP-N-acetylmuramyl pentapeptide phosphotransferase/UDP-N-acetylglucosamine-1-phosphate transferase